MFHVGQVSGAFVSGKTQASPNSCGDYQPPPVCVHSRVGTHQSGMICPKVSKSWGFDDPCKNVQEFPRSDFIMA